ncbi:tetratricopeptide repeat protein [Kaarinaea lacus]
MISWKSLRHVLGCYLLAVSHVWAFPGQSLESIEYLEQGDVAAIEIGFSEPIQYLSHFPLSSATTLRVFLGPRTEVDPAIDNLPWTQVMRAPVSREIPLTQVSFIIDEKGDKSVVIEFDDIVSFKVSQGRSANSFLVLLPDYSLSLGMRIQAEKSADEEITQTRKLLNLGIEALKEKNNKKAIQIFTKILSMPKSKESMAAMEMLGIARERNNQLAHAKVLYQEYLKLYPDEEGAARVKQRLNDLLYGQLKPKARLKTPERKKATTSRVFGNFAQYYYRGQNSTEETGTVVDQSLLLNQLSLNWRIRSSDYEVRNFFYASHSYDFETETERPLTIETAYSQFKNSSWGLSGRLGRQSGSKGGVLGKYDGVQALYGITKRLSLGVVSGYPVNISDKRRIQKERPLWGINFEWDGMGDDVDILPYYIKQKVDGLTDREAIGTEFRYFGKKGNYYGLVDYDIYYSDLNLYIFRGQYNLKKNTSLNLGLDFRNSPLLYTSAALIGQTNAETIEELQDTYSEDQIKDLAELRVGNAKTVSFGISHVFNPRYQVNADLTLAKQEFIVEDAVTSEFSVDKEGQVYLSGQLIAGQWLNDRDITVLGLRLSSTDSYDESSFYVSNRLPIQKSWKLDTRYRVDFRKNQSGEKLVRHRPSIKVDNRFSQKMRLEMEIGVEVSQYSGVTNNTDFQRLFVNGGYSYNF